MIILDGTNADIVELVTSSTANINSSLHYVDTQTDTPKLATVAITTATTTTLLTGSGTGQFCLKSIYIANIDASVANTIKFRVKKSGTSYLAYTVTLNAGDSLIYEDGAGFYVLDANGNVKNLYSFPSASANLVYASPDGAAGSPLFRQLLLSDQESRARPLQNYIINGACDVDQRATGAATVGTGLGTDVYGTDRWKFASENSNTQFTRTDTNGATETGLNARYYGKISKKTGTGKQAIFQVIEGVNTMPLAGRKMTFQIKLKASSSKTLRMAILSSTGTIDVMPTLVPATWGGAATEPTWTGTLASLVPASIPSGAQGTISGSSVSCAVTTSWQLFAGSFTMPGNAKNLVLVVYTDAQFTFNTDTFSWSECIFSDGGSIRDWLPPIITDEILKVQRYIEVWNSDGNTPALCVGVAFSTNTTRGSIPFLVKKRIPPAITASAAGDFDGVDASNANQNPYASLAFGNIGCESYLFDAGGCTGSHLVAGNAVRVLAHSTSARLYYDSDF